MNKKKESSLVSCNPKNKVAETVKYISDAINDHVSKNNSVILIFTVKIGQGGIRDREIQTRRSY